MDSVTDIEPKIYNKYFINKSKGYILLRDSQHYIYCIDTNIIISTNNLVLDKTYLSHKGVSIRKKM